MGQTLTLHVAPSGDGRWSVQRSGASRASANLLTQAAAIEYARKLAGATVSELYVHDRDGVVLQKNSYGTVAAKR